MDSAYNSIKIQDTDANDQPIRLNFWKMKSDYFIKIWN